MHIRAWVGAAISVAVVAALFAQDRPSAPRISSADPTLDEIRGGDIAAHIKVLADDLLEGRAPSTRGGRLAAAYLATQLAAPGYGPAGDKGTYFQDVAIVGHGHRPSDEFQPGWNYAGAVQDMRLLAELGWRLASDPAMPACNPNEQFARLRK